MPRRRPLLDKPPEPAAQRAASEQIIKAVVAAAIELGPTATLSEIAERAGVGTASLHRYFPSTAAIFAEVSRQSYRTLIDQIRALAARDDLDLRGMVHAICKTALEGTGLSNEHRRRMNLEIPLVWSMGTAERVYEEVLAEVARWIRTNVAEPPDDLDARLFVAFGTIRGAVLMSLLFPALAPPRDELLPALADSVLLAMTSPRPGGGEPPSS